MGDWESDTIIGKGNQQAIVTLVERKSRYLVMRKVEKRTAEKDWRDDHHDVINEEP